MDMSLDRTRIRPPSANHGRDFDAVSGLNINLACRGDYVVKPQVQRSNLRYGDQTSGTEVKPQVKRSNLRYKGQNIGTGKP